MRDMFFVVIYERSVTFTVRYCTQYTICDRGNVKTYQRSKTHIHACIRAIYTLEKKYCCIDELHFEV